MSTVHHISEQGDYISDDIGCATAVLHWALVPRQPGS